MNPLSRSPDNKNDTFWEIYMKQITAFIHHVRSADVIEALRDAGYKTYRCSTSRGP